MRASGFLAAALIGMAASPAFADCAAEIQRISKLNARMSSAATQEYQAAQAAHQQRKEAECMQHIQAADAQMRSSGSSSSAGQMLDKFIGSGRSK